VLVSDTHKFVFHHVPSTAGSSITSVLAKYCRGYKGQPEYFGGSAGIGGYAWPDAVHCGYEMHTPVRDTDFPDDYFSFAFVRKPSDMDFVCGKDKNTIVDFVGRYENLQEDFDFVCSKVGIEKTTLPRWNIGGENGSKFLSSNLEASSNRVKDFGYVVIDNLFSEDELNDINNELIHLDYIMNLKSVKDIRLKDGAEGLLNGDGLTLDNVYANRDYSSILKYNRKLWSEEVVELFCSSHPANIHYALCNLDSTFINRYTDSQGYKAHRDVSSFSSVTTFLKGGISGSKFIFPEYNIEIETKHNQCIIFPSWVLHEATAIQTEGGTRYSMAMFSSQTLGANK